mmetsp:Transcript_72658/g.201478  ORF Transcript_72658/g.201478 Transcript_72658/m.201478 type:complete len:127 (-) Transcript_72658:896-1276(-)
MMMRTALIKSDPNSAHKSIPISQNGLHIIHPKEHMPKQFAQQLQQLPQLAQVMQALQLTQLPQHPVASTSGFSSFAVGISACISKESYFNVASLFLIDAQTAASSVRPKAVHARHETRAREKRSIT